MTETRRHSVDIPLSRTLVALKRVRSLRDPDTSSLSKIAALVDNIVLETSSCNGVIIGSTNGGSKRSLAQREDIHQLQGAKLDPAKYSLSYFHPSVPDASATRSVKNACVHGSCSGNMRRSLDSKLMPSCTNCLEEELDLFHNDKFQQLEMIRSSSLKQPLYGGSYRSKDVDLMCNAETQCACSVGACKPVDPATEECDLAFLKNATGVHSCHCSRVSKYDGLKHPSHVEVREFQLNSQFDKESVFGGSTPAEEETMSLIEKYKPKMFHELAGQSEVTQSLLDAILRRKIAPIYLFQGPRGTGKTSAARIFAAALNCHSHEERRPCGSCQDCKLVFMGRNRDVAELNASETNHQEWSKFLSESVLAPRSTRFKIFIIDECQLIERSTWSAICKTMEELSKHAVFIMITSELDKLPCVTLSLCQRYHFLKLKDHDIVSRLQKICMEEELEVEEDVLIFLAKESSGSLRDAIATLDQLALLGKRITSSLAFDLMGAISEAELLKLLQSALSSDTSSTVKRARELMRTGICPMKLTSQLAKIITDILSGECGSVGSKSIAGASKEKLTDALKILVETEKQLRTSKDKSTWLTAALLQFNTGESFSPSRMNDSMASQEVARSTDEYNCLCTSPKESIESSTFCNNELSTLEKHYDEAEMKSIWHKTIENCRSKSIKSFLWKEGRLSSILVHEGSTVADVIFRDPDHARRAEEFREVIVASLQSILSRNVDVRISLDPTVTDRASRKKSFWFLCCSGARQKAPVYSSGRSTTLCGRRLCRRLQVDFQKQASNKGIDKVSSPNQKEKSCIMALLHFKSKYSRSSLQ
ncbi:protein STICHEL-like 2 [Curcuma longa]|uniref:protein STICHEL-like 2 n=1 Tax=Curcuma longa TaxID=136217 RepID=UPI003D9F55CF